MNNQPVGNGPIVGVAVIALILCVVVVAIFQKDPPAAAHERSRVQREARQHLQEEQQQLRDVVHELKVREELERQRRGGR